MGPMKKKSAKPPLTERRTAFERRRYVAEMSPEEMRRELLTSEVAGLPNRRAFDEAGESPAVAISDVDGLKALNQYGYEVGNAALRAKAEALRQAGLEAYHDKGDEFLCRASDRAQLAARLELARARLRDRTIAVELPDGSTLQFIGLDFSYGIGRNIGEAERKLRTQKAKREKTGQLARGELVGIRVKVFGPKSLSSTGERRPASAPKLPGGLPDN